MVAAPEDSVAFQLRKVSRLLALQAIGGKTKSEGVMMLALSGFETSEIALLVGTSEGSVRAMLSQGRRTGRPSDPGN